MVEVVTPASDLSLTLLATVKSRLGITDASQDTVLTALIKGASETMINYTGFVWPKQDYRERLHGSGAVEAQLSRRPLVSISQLSVGKSVIDPGDYSIIDKAQAVIFRSVGWPSQRYAVPGVAGWLMPTESGMTERNMVVEYVAGYTTPIMGSPDLPADVEEICIEIVSWSFKQRDSLPINEVDTPNLRIVLDKDSSLKISDSIFHRLDPWIVVT